MEKDDRSEIEDSKAKTMPASRFLCMDFMRRSFYSIFHHLWVYSSACLLMFYLLYVTFSNLFVGALVLISVLAFIYSSQDNLLYHPNTPPESRYFVESPARFGLPHEDVFLQTRDGVRIHAYLIKQPSPSSNNAFTFIFLHGNAGNIGHRLLNAQNMYRYCGMNLLLLEYRGYGRSKGSPSEEGLVTDALAAIEFIFSRPDLNHSKVVLFGRSLGGAVAVGSASTLNPLRSQVAGMIVENTFTSIIEMSKAIFKLPIFDYWPNFLVKNKFESIEKMSEIQVPTLFISGLQDELVPPYMMRQLFERSRSILKRLLLLPQGTHNESWRCPGYYAQIVHFLKEIEELRQGKQLLTSQVLTASS